MTMMWRWRNACPTPCNLHYFTGARTALQQVWPRYARLAAPNSPHHDSSLSDDGEGAGVSRRRLWRHSVYAIRNGYGWGRGVGVPCAGGVRCGVARGDGVAPGCGVSVAVAVGPPVAVPVGVAPFVGDAPAGTVGCAPGAGVVAPLVIGLEFPRSVVNAPDCVGVAAFGWGSTLTPISNAPTSAAAMNAPVVSRRSSTPSPPSYARARSCASRAFPSLRRLSRQKLGAVR